MSFIDWIVKGIIILVLGLLKRLGWKPAEKWQAMMLDIPIDQIIAKELDKDDKPVV